MNSSPKHFMDKDGVPSVPLQVLLTYPIFWKPSKICHFFKEVYKQFRDEQTENPIRRKKNYDFIKTLNNEALEQCILAHDGNWKNIVGENFEYFKTKYSVKDGHPQTSTLSVNPTSMWDLVKVIRNKHEHGRDFPSNIKNELKWFKDDCILLDDLKFVKYWTNKFPNLLLFLWRKLIAYESVLPDYYLENVDKFCVLKNLESVAEAISISIDECIGAGSLEFRYSSICDGKPLSLEIFQLELGATLQDISAIQLFKDYIKFVWCDSGESEFKSLSYFGNTMNCATALVFANPNNFNRTSCIVSNSNIKRFLVFSSNINASNVQTIVETFTNLGHTTFEENPIKWDDLSFVVQQRVLSQGQANFQGRLCNLDTIMPKNQQEKQELLSKLVGKSLNNLLKSGQLDVFSKLGIPFTTKNYIERLIINRSFVDASIFSERIPCMDILLVENITAENFQKFVETSNQLAFVINDSFKSTSFVSKIKNAKVLILEDNENDYTTVMTTLSNMAQLRNIHVFRHVHDRKFFWSRTVGILETFDEILVKASRQIEMFDESKFLENVEKSTVKIFCIADKPGMGKTQILASFALKLMQKYQNRCVISVCVSKFTETLSTKFGKNADAITEEHVVKVLTNFACNNDFEKLLLKKFLYTKSSQIKIELLFDGFDELNYKSRNLAIKSIQLIYEKMSAVRIWVASRDHMLQEIMDKFGNCMENAWKFCLEPFSETDQISFLTNYWLDFCKNSALCLEIPDIGDLEKFAAKCIKVKISGQDAELAGVPLQCRMIAEINEGKVLNGEYKNYTTEESFSLPQLYKQLIKKKVEVYLREKNNYLFRNWDDPIAKRELDYSIRCHTYFAIKLLISKSMAEEFRSVLELREKPDSELNYIAESQGIIQKLEPLTFVHRTYAEYLLIRFVLKVLKRKYVTFKPDDKLFKQLLWEEIFHVVMQNPDKCCKVKDVIIKHPTLWHFCDVMWSKGQCKCISDLLAPSLYVASGAYAFTRNTFLKKHCPLFFALQTTRFKNLAGFFAMCSDEIFPIFYLLLKCGMYPQCDYIVRRVKRFVPRYCEHVRKNGYFDQQQNGILHYVVRNLRGVPLVQDKKFMTVQRYRERAFSVLYESIQEFANRVNTKDTFLLKETNARGETPLQLLRRLYHKHFWIDQYTLFMYSLGKFMHHDEDDRKDFTKAKRCPCDKRSREAPF